MAQPCQVSRRAHDATSAILGALTLFFSWRSGGDAPTNHLAAAGFASVYWVTQAGAILYPNTLYFDPEFDLPKTYIHGLPAQAMFQIVFLSLTGIGGVLGLRSILPDMQTGAFQGAREFARFDERGRIMPHAWQQAQHIFGHRDGGKPRQQVAVDGIEQEQRARKQDPRHLCHQLAFNRSSQLVAQAAITAQNMVPSARH